MALVIQCITDTARYPFNTDVDCMAMGSNHEGGRMRMVFSSTTTEVSTWTYEVVAELLKLLMYY